LREIIARFREKGATSPEKAMTAQELGLPPRFEDAMKRRLGSTGIFVETSGKYYLDETKLQQVEERRRAAGGTAQEGGQASGKNVLALRIARRVIGVAALLLALVNILYIGSAYLRAAVVVLVVVWLVLTVYQIYYLARLRRNWTAPGPANDT
jgi:Flp pilus assembly protein TadB